MTEVFLGTSGWSYDEWIGAFYPSKKTKKLTYYSKIFNTAEIDSTFYAYPRKGFVFGWDKNTPSGFRFSAKLPSLITHEKELDLEKGVEIDLVHFLELVYPLKVKGKLGAILIQLPPKFKKDGARLEDFLAILPGDQKFAIEFRNRSWWNRDTWALLEKYNIANTIVDEPLLPPDPIITADFSFLRWHGKRRRPWYNYWYRKEELEPWIPKLKDISNNVKEVYGYFNNHFHGYAVQNCLQTMEMLGSIKPEQSKAKSRVDSYLKKKATKEATLQLTMPEAEELGLEGLIELFTGKERLKRAIGIKDDDVSKLEIDEDSIEARIRDYDVLIDVKNRVILHNCADWARCIPDKKFCKHMGKLFIRMSREDSTELLKKILKERDSWDLGLIELE